MPAPGSGMLAATGDDAPRTVLGTMHPDFVVLQEQSRMPLDDPERMQDFAGRFCKLIARKQAVPVLSMTWARASEPEQQDRIAEQYVAAAKAGAARLAPVGRAWQCALAADATQKLHVEDGSHPNPSGTYLAACVLHATIFGSDVHTFPDRLVRTADDGSEQVLIDLPHAEGERLRDAAAAALRPAAVPTSPKRD